MNSREKDLDEKEYILLDDYNIKKYGLNPNNLYSYNKKSGDEIEILTEPIKPINKHTIQNNILYKLFSSIVKGGDPEGIEYLTTYSEKPNIKEMEKMTQFINKNSPLCVHIPFKFNEKTYYIEYTAKKKSGIRSEKIIMSISLDREHIEEIIHISCFPHSFIHLTFIINEKHYKIYQKYNPNISNRFNDIIQFIMNCIKLFEILIKKNNAFNISVWCNNRTNNWREEVITKHENISILYEYIMVFLESIKYLITRKFFIERFLK